MDKDNSTQTLYSFIYAYEMAKHEHNAKRIKLTIRYFFIIPMILLAFMFFTGSSNIVFLMLWIVSLFSIAAYAIIIEYNDYELQKRMHIMEQLKDGVNVIELDASNMLPLLNRKEFQAFGIDKTSAGMALSAYNRQKRKERKALPPPEATPPDTVSTENAVADNDSTKKPRKRKTKSKSAAEQQADQETPPDAVSTENAVADNDSTKKPRKRKTKPKSAAEQQADQETPPDAVSAENIVADTVSTENAVADNDSTKKPRKRKTKSKSTAEQQADQKNPQTITASETGREGGHEQ